MARADAPGRVNLIGEHTDYNDGLVLPTAIPQRTAVDLSPRGDDRVALASDGFPRVSYRLGDERRTGDWGDYVRGVTWALADAGAEVGGFDARVRSDIPPGAGLASSAALEVAVLRALRDAFSLELDDVALALLAHRAESELVGARVGTMDQLAASLSRDGEALLIDTRTLRIERIVLPPELGLVVVDSGVAHEHAGGGYNERRAQCEAAAAALGLETLRDATLDAVAVLAARDRVLARRARHVVSENVRVREFVDALRGVDLARCGRVLDASHASLRDDFEISTPEVDVLVSLLRAEDGVYGARIVGGGFGGAVLAIARPDTARRAAETAAGAYAARTGLEPRILLPAR